MSRKFKVSKMKLFETLANNFQSVINFTKNSILDFPEVLDKFLKITRSQKLFPNSK